MRGLPGVHTIDVDGPTALLELTDAAAAGPLLRAALERGEVHEFAPQRATLAEIYREVTA